jgi:hypothetical protein
MLAIITAWLASQGASLVLGALTKLALDAWNSYQANKSQRDVATAQSELAQAKAGQQATQAELQAQIDAPKTVDDAAKRLEGGTA